MEVAGGRVRGLRGPFTCNQCSNRLKDDKILRTNPNFACGYTSQVPSAVSGTVLGRSMGANSTYCLNQLKQCTQQPQYTACNTVCTARAPRLIIPHIVAFAGMHNNATETCTPPLQPSSAIRSRGSRAGNCCTIMLPPPPPPCISYALRRRRIDDYARFESVGLSVGTCRWTFHRSWISYALVQATVGVGTRINLVPNFNSVPNVVQPHTWV